MKCCAAFIVLVLFFNAANATFWKNDDFERIVDSYANSMSQDYLRALSLFKRKLQLLGFYPIVLNDDGLEYVSMEPYLIEDDYDDRMYKLLKEMRKEKKSRKKALKRKLKKTKKTTTTTEAPPVTTTTTTTVQPISNIVYYWPSTITTIVHPSTTSSTSYQHSFDTKIDISESSEENSSEVNSNASEQMNKNDKPAKINYSTRFSFERKLNFDDEANKQTRLPSIPTTTTTTPYPLVTVVPEDILNQQEIFNKITESGKDERNGTKTISDDLTADVSFGSIPDNLIEADTIVKVPLHLEVPTLSETPTRIKENISEEIVASEATSADTTTSIDITETATSAFATESPLLIPTGALQFFHETLPDEPSASPSSEIVTNVPVSNSADALISHEIAEIAENDKNTDGHRETGTQFDYSVVQLNEETTTPFNEPLMTTTPKPSDGNKQLESAASNTSQNANDDGKDEGYQYLIDPKITLESRSLLTDEPLLVAVIDDKSGRRSDVPIEADDIINEEDTTDNLAYNLTDENLLEQSNVVKNTSAETSTPSPSNPPAPLNLNDPDEFDGEIIPLIPIIIKQMKQGNVSPEEMEILKNTFGPFWPYIVEEASRDGDSSEEMNPLLSEVLNSVNRKIVKRFASPTFGMWNRRPVYREGRRRRYYSHSRRRGGRPNSAYY